MSEPTPDSAEAQAERIDREQYQAGRIPAEPFVRAGNMVVAWDAAQKEETE